MICLIETVHGFFEIPNSKRQRSTKAQFDCLSSPVRLYVFLDVRVIFATNRMPSEMVKNGLMREDFYYRISMIPINLPPLRERKEDIPLLVDHFLTQYSEDEKKPVLTGKIMDILYNYEWPGNVRELLSVIRRYLVLGDFPILDMGEKTDNLELGIDRVFLPDSVFSALPHFPFKS